jgi:hypothetical protein
MMQKKINNKKQIKQGTILFKWSQKVTMDLNAWDEAFGL